MVVANGNTITEAQASARAQKETGKPKRCLVVGCAANIWDDVRAALDISDYHAVYCVKQAGIHWPGKFECLVTLHPEYMLGENDLRPKLNYVAERRALGYPDGYEIVSPLDSEVGAHKGKCKIARKVSYKWPGMTSSASSGIYAAKVALDDGFDRIVLAGIPMTVAAGHFLPNTINHMQAKRGAVQLPHIPELGKLAGKTGNYWGEFLSFRAGFEIAKPFLRGKVRSMSGLTKEILGHPTAEWLGQA